LHASNTNARIKCFSEDALQQVDEYLREKEGEEESHLIGVFKLEI
jgi:hypothetical protein